jgi:hypothetical protein
MQPQPRSRPSDREQREQYQVPHRGIPFLSPPCYFSDFVPSCRLLNHAIRHPHRPLRVHSPFHLFSPSRTVCRSRRLKLKCRCISDNSDALILSLVCYLGPPAHACVSRLEEKNPECFHMSLLFRQQPKAWSPHLSTRRLRTLILDCFPWTQAYPKTGSLWVRG